MYIFEENKLDWCWILNDGTVWSTQENSFVNEAYQSAWLERSELTTIPVSPVDTSGVSSQEGLIEALNFYELPLGTLETEEQKYSAERSVVEQKYSAPWDGTTGGLLTLTQMTIVSALAAGQDTSTLYAQYSDELTAMSAEFQAIDEKYGVV